MKLYIVIGFLLSSVMTFAERELLLIVSEPGTEAYDVIFRDQAEAWQLVAKQGEFKLHTIGLDENSELSDYDRLETLVKTLKYDGDDLWIVFLGHGSYDGKNAHFNLREEDLKADDLSNMLKPFNRRMVMLHLFSASAPFAQKLKGKNRIQVVANRSGGQRNYSRFGEMVAKAILDESSDLDGDKVISLLELSLVASFATLDYYKNAQRVVAENAVIDDNGDGLPTELGQFEGLFAKTLPSAKTPDGLTAQTIYLSDKQVIKLSPKGLAQRAKVEKEISTLKQKKNEIGEEDYYTKLEHLLLRQAHVYKSEGVKTSNNN